MGLSGIGLWQALIILALVILLFGGKKLRTAGADIGGAIQGFKRSMRDAAEADKEQRPG